MVDGHGVDAASGSLVHAGFAAAMTIGRFGGSSFLDRFGRTTVVRASAVSGALGLILVIFSDNVVPAGAAMLVVLAFVASAVFLAPAVGTRRRSATVPQSESGVS
ncbi:hypothetical protein [Nonomuraea jabiensis]|uniref:hypothetical protein n=1 Tax=Nonomuraea jabiensis TaxID=882448 RepID=UPI003D71C9FB